MLRILLINPPSFKIQEAFYDTPPYPRTALAFLGAQLRLAGVDVHVLDCKYDRLGYEAGMRALKDLEPDIVGFTAFTNEVIQAAHFAQLVKEWNPQIYTIIGGVHVSSIPEETLREFPQFDYGVIGEGEETLLELVHGLERQREPHTIPGVCCLLPDKTYVAASIRQQTKADNLPVPAWDMFRPAKQYILHTQRGCPFDCLFCANPNGHSVRSSSAENVLDEIEMLVNKHGKLKLLFGDEVFSLKRERTEAICNGFIERGLNKKISWWCVTHVRCIDLELAILMKKAGCQLVGLGVESGNEEGLKEINKGTTINLIQDVVIALKQANLDFEAYFILGQPNETYKTAMNTINFAVKINPSRPVFGIMVPYPGTMVWKMAQAGEGGYVLRSRDWNDYNKQLGNALSIKDISRETLENLQLWGYIKVFLFNWRLWAFLKLSWQFRTTSFIFLHRFIKRLFLKRKFLLQE